MNRQRTRHTRDEFQSERLIKQRHLERLRRKRRKQFLTRAIVAIVLFLVVISVVLFATPIFNTESINVEGNNRVSKELVEKRLSDLVGKNLICISSGDIKDRVEDLMYIDSVDMDKEYFPPTLTVTIKEKIPCAYYDSNGEYVILDEKCDVLEKTKTPPDDVPELTTYFESVKDALNDEEASNAIKTFLELIARVDIVDGITSIELCEGNEFKFTYEDRLEVICGSNVELEEKLRLFKVTVDNPNLSANAHGTMDLSTPGKAMYTP